MGFKKQLKETRALTLDQIELLEMEYDEIINHTEPPSNKGIFAGFRLLSSVTLETLYAERKDRKYAALTMELSSLIEQFLKTIYIQKHGQSYRTQNGRGNIIEKLEDSLSQDLTFGCTENKKETIKLLVQMRNHIAHEDFSFEKAKARLNVDKPDKKLFRQMLKHSKEYISSVSINNN